MKHMFRAFLVSVLLTCGAGAASAQSDEVVALFEQGLAAYRLANYEEAEQLFAQAHALEALPDLSYNHARTLELLGRFGDAADVYARFLEEAPDAEDRDVIETRIRNLRARHARGLLAAVPEPAEPETEPAEPEPEPELPAPVEPESTGPSVVGPLLLIGGGLALGAAGVGTGLAGTSAHDTAVDAATSQRDADAANRRATRLARTTNVLFVVGAAALAAGFTWMVVKLVGGDESEAEVSLQLSPAGVALHGAF